MKRIFNSDYKITQVFGARPEYYKQFGLKGHEGIDLIPSNSDWTIISPDNNGQVVRDNDRPTGNNYGNFVTIWYPEQKIALQFCHMSENYLKIGDSVQQGQRIGKMGSSGNSTGPHLHLNVFQVDDSGFRINLDNGYLGGIDPLPYLEEKDSLDKVRLERDRNWNLYQEQIKKTTELQKEIDELKKNQINPETVNSLEETINILRSELKESDNKMRQIHNLSDLNAL